MFDTLDILPIKTYYRILETDNFHLLNPNGSDFDDAILLDLWEELKERFQELDNNQLTDRIFNLSKNYDYYILTYEVVLMSVESLEFRYDEDLIILLKKLGYKVRRESYKEDLENVKRFANGLLIKANHFKSQLPKEDVDVKSSANTTIDDVIASYEEVTGRDFGDYNVLACTKFLAIKKQVEAKIKQQEKQLSQLKNKNGNGK